jgi:hypothetical protein
MIIKTKDSMVGAQQELEGLLQLPLNTKQRFLVERELKIFKAGERGEQDSAYFLDFAYGKSENWALIHDLRIEWQGRVAQIDHLAINRLLQVFVLETKNYFYGMKINDLGEFNIWNGKIYIGIESPIEQNKRHVSVLEERVNARKLTPKRLGIPLPIFYRPYVLVSPKSRIIRPNRKIFPTDNVVKADQYKTLMDKRIDDMSPLDVLGNITKMVSSQTVEEFASGIAGLHRPSKIDYRAKFGIPETFELTKQTCEENHKQVVSSVGASVKLEKSPKCGKCDGKNVLVVYGKYGYYIKCKDCDQNTAIKEFCPTCNEKSRIRKDKNVFYLECSSCMSSKLYHKNT